MPDGIGACTKRTADRRVTLRNDLNNFEASYQTRLNKVNIFVKTKQYVPDLLLSDLNKPLLKTVKNNAN